MNSVRFAEQVVKRLAEYNPYHDARGRFATTSGSSMIIPNKLANPVYTKKISVGSRQVVKVAEGTSPAKIAGEKESDTEDFTGKLKDGKGRAVGYTITKVTTNDLESSDLTGFAFIRSFKSALSNTNCEVTGMKVGNRLVGLCSVTNSSRNNYTEVNYMSAYRKHGEQVSGKDLRGIGTNMLANVCKNCRPGGVHLESTLDAESFYKKIGMRNPGTSMSYLSVFEFSKREAKSFASKVLGGK